VAQANFFKFSLRLLWHIIFVMQSSKIPGTGPAQAYNETQDGPGQGRPHYRKFGETG
jgi:hypothetical protein